VTRTLPLILALAACSSPAEDTSSTDVGDTASTGTSTATGSTSTSGSTTDNWICRDDVDPSELNGVFPPSELAAPQFSALNRDGTERGPTDLMPRPTVMWFYPKAGTAG